MAWALDVRKSRRGHRGFGLLLSQDDGTFSLFVLREYSLLSRHLLVIV